MSKTRSGSPHLRGHRTNKETSAIWELAREGQNPDDIGRAFRLDAEGVEKIRKWQLDNGVQPAPPPKSKKCQHCGCSGACR